MDGCALDVTFSCNSFRNRRLAVVFEAVFYFIQWLRNAIEKLITLLSSAVPLILICTLVAWGIVLKRQLLRQGHWQHTLEPSMLSLTTFLWRRVVSIMLFQKIEQYDNWQRVVIKHIVLRESLLPIPLQLSIIVFMYFLECKGVCEHEDSRSQEENYSCSLVCSTHGNAFCRGNPGVLSYKLDSYTTTSKPSESTDSKTKKPNNNLLSSCTLQNEEVLCISCLCESIVPDKQNPVTTEAIVCSNEGSNECKTYNELIQQQNSSIQRQICHEILANYPHGRDNNDEGDYRCDSKSVDDSIYAKSEPRRKNTVRDCVSSSRYSVDVDSREYSFKSLQSESSGYDSGSFRHQSVRQVGAENSFLLNDQCFRRESIAVAHVLDVGGCQSLSEICQQSFNVSLPELQNSSSSQTAQFPVTVSQMFGVVTTTSSSSSSRTRSGSTMTVDWNEKLTYLEPTLHISHFEEWMSDIQSPILLVVSSEILQGNGGSSDVLDNILQNWMNGRQQSLLHVVIADETTADPNSDDEDMITKLLETKLRNYTYKLWYWSALQHTFSMKSSAKNAHIATALKNAAIHYAKSSTPLLEYLEEVILKERNAGARTLSLEKVRSLTRSRMDKDSLPQAVEHLEHKGLIVRTSMRSRMWAESGHARSSLKHGIDTLPQMFIISPMWFCHNANQFIEAVVDQSNKENARLVPSARTRGFYNEEILQFANRSFSGCLPYEVKKLLEVSGVIFSISNALSGSRSDDLAVYATGSTSVAPTVPNYRSSYFIPATLQVESLPPLKSQAVFPIALRVPGKDITKIPLTVFYDVISVLTKRFPLAVRCTPYEARFNVQPNHVLQLAYDDDHGCIFAKVFVETEDPTFMLTVTAHVCSSIRELLSLYVRKRFGSTQVLQFAAVNEWNSDGQILRDFVDLGDNKVMPTDQLYSVGSHPFYPPDDFFLWFGTVRKPTTIRQHFNELLQQLNDASIDILLAAVSLFQIWEVTQVEMEKIVLSDIASRPYVLLLMLQKRGEKGYQLLENILKDPALRKKEDVQLSRRQEQTFEQSYSRGESRLVTKPKEAKGVFHQLSDEVERDGLPQPNVSNESSNQHQLNTSTLIQRGVPSSQISKLNTYRPDDPSVVVPRQDHIESDCDSPLVAANPTSVSHCASVISANKDEHVQLTSREQSGNSIVVPSSTSASIANRSSTTVSSQTVGTSQSTTDKFQVSPSVQPNLTQHEKEEPEIHQLFECKFRQVQDATGNFDEKPLHEGGKRVATGQFGTVYYGVLHSEHAQKFEVAIKRLKNASSLNITQVDLSRRKFETEINILTRYEHPNIVKLLGFSSDGPQLCLLYEYVSGGSLSQRLDCKCNTSPIEWHHRLRIGRDIGLALEFLHTRYRQPIIHRDVRSSNILLGSRMEAKLIDFGLAIVGWRDEDQQEASKYSRLGTVPYLPPETVSKGYVSCKTDVYALGMVLFEVSTGLPPYSRKKKQDLRQYISFIEGQNVKLVNMLDPKAKWPKGQETFGSCSFGLNLLDIAKFATTVDYKQRPQISTVVRQLQQLADHVESQ